MTLYNTCNRKDRMKVTECFRLVQTHMGWPGPLNSSLLFSTGTW